MHYKKYYDVHGQIHSPLSIKCTAKSKFHKPYYNAVGININGTAIQNIEEINGYQTPD